MQIVMRVMGRSCGAPVLLIAALWIAAPDSGEAACPDYRRTRNLYFGDLHVHTALSHDAFAMQTYALPADAYESARSYLDFMAATDHAEFLAETKLCAAPASPAYEMEICENLRNGILSIAELKELCRAPEPLVDPRVCANVADQVWTSVQQAANQAYRRCEFTTFTGYEYSPGIETAGATLHRNVIFGSTAVPERPISWFDEGRVVNFLRELAATCVPSEGCTVLAIPHNTNQSEGAAFATSDMTAEEADLRARYEPLVEVFQHKGSSECFPLVGNDDAECAFEQLSIEQILPVGSDDVPLTSFVRDGLKAGLVVEERFGVNPFRVGMIGGTDTHAAAGGMTDEAAYIGHNGVKDDAIEERLNDTFATANPGGLVAVWAEENTREALYAALRRREVYGTSGTRMSVRFFGGWGYADALCSEANPMGVAYREGVAMGSNLRSPAGLQPAFFVSAWQDPEGARIEEIQIVKGWNEHGVAYERVHTVARASDQDGASMLCTVWKDAEFDTAHAAFYYARILETPTPRWSARDCEAAGVVCHVGVSPLYAACCDGSLPETIRERAWTSPIWYHP